jgi:ABC-type glycerol-3-phosphate transport system permease component
MMAPKNLHTNISRCAKKKRKKAVLAVKLSIAFLIAAIFAALFLTPIVLTISNSFMAESEISANYGQVFAKTESGGKVYIAEKINLKFITVYAASSGRMEIKNEKIRSIT